MEESNERNETEKNWRVFEENLNLRILKKNMRPPVLKKNAYHAILYYVKPRKIKIVCEKVMRLFSEKKTKEITIRPIYKY